MLAMLNKDGPQPPGQPPKQPDDPHASSNLFSGGGGWKARKTRLASDNDFGGDGDFAFGAQEIEKKKPAPVPAAQRQKSVMEGDGLFGASDMMDKAGDKKPTKVGLFDNDEDQEELE
jgi:hypothetical protein